VFVTVGPAVGVFEIGKNSGLKQKASEVSLQEAQKLKETIKSWLP
jgi:hypothetical protein